MARAPAAVAAVAAAAAAADAGDPKLAELELRSVISLGGEVWPPLDAAARAWVFAVYDKHKELRFVGFSKDLRNSLRTVLVRQPEECHYYKAAALAELDQERMVAIRASWFEEHGSSPVGNTAAGRLFWQQPVDAGAISERGKPRAARQKGQEIVRDLKARGLVEELELDPELLAQGKVDVLPAPALDEAQLRKVEAERSARAANTRHGVATVDGKEVPFSLFFSTEFQSNSGWVYDVVLTASDTATNHRVICGDMYVESLALAPEEVVLRTFEFLLRKKVPRATNGVLGNTQFGMGYFAVGSVEQAFPDFAAEFERPVPGEDLFWRFNRIIDHKDFDPPMVPDGFAQRELTGPGAGGAGEPGEPPAVAAEEEEEGLGAAA